MHYRLSMVKMEFGGRNQSNVGGIAQRRVRLKRSSNRNGRTAGLPPARDVNYISNTRTLIIYCLIQRLEQKRPLPIPRLLCLHKRRQANAAPTMTGPSHTLSLDGRRPLHSSTSLSDQETSFVLTEVLETSSWSFFRRRNQSLMLYLGSERHIGDVRSL